LATIISKALALSKAEALAISKYLQRSLGVNFPFPSAIFKATEVDALSNCSQTANFLVIL